MTAATEADLTWWLELAPALRWTWASTYAEAAPHWYVVHGRTPGLTRDDFVRVARVVRTFGEPGKFYAMTNLYLYTADRRLKFWCIWDPTPVNERINIINLATTEQSYGPQRDFDEERLAQLRLTQ